MICGLVLAAGAGTRFGERSKLLAELDGRPLLEHAIAAQCAVGELERVAVVLGAFADEVLVGVDFMRAEPVVCERWEEGQALSLRRGIEYLTDGSAVRKEFAPIRKEYIAKATAVLSLEQQQTWDGLVGRPFEIQEEAQPVQAGGQSG